jgi:hypothetical protein
MNTPSKSHEKLIRRLERAYDRAIRAEENAATLAQAYRRAKVSERCLRQLQAVRAGLPLPAPRVPRTARNLAKQGLAALAAIGRSIARAVNGAAALRKAQVANAARKVAREAARQARKALRSVVRQVVSLALRAVALNTPKKEIIVMKAPKLAARIHAGQGHNYCQISVDHWGLLQFTDDAGRFQLVTELRGDRFVFSGGVGEHSIAADETITPATRLLAHWQGYVDNTVRAFAEATSRRVTLGPLNAMQTAALAKVLVQS